MKITPLDIRQKTFEKHFRGYDKDEVTSFLTLMSQEWEKMTEEKKMLQMKFEQSEKEASKLREVEASLFKTLKTAEDTGASIIEQANKTAELILKEAQMNAESLNAESRNKARNMVDQAESQAKNIMEDLKEDINLLVDNYEKLLSQRESLLKSLKKMAAETLDNVKSAQEDFTEADISAHSRMLKELQRKDKYYSSMGRDERFTKEDKYRTYQESPEPEHTYTWEQTGEKAKMSPDEVPDTADTTEKKETNASQTKPLSAKQQVQDKDALSPEEADEKKQSGSFFDQFD